ncbi:hypothetical protein ACWCOT_18405 [Nonomuraea bangladeshensis]
MSGAATRTQIVEAADRLFYDRGYEQFRGAVAVGLSEVKLLPGQERGQPAGRMLRHQNPNRAGPECLRWELEVKCGDDGVKGLQLTGGFGGNDAERPALPVTNRASTTGCRPRALSARLPGPTGPTSSVWTAPSTRQPIT